MFKTKDYKRRLSALLTLVLLLTSSMPVYASELDNTLLSEESLVMSESEPLVDDSESLQETDFIESSSSTLDSIDSNVFTLVRYFEDENGEYSTHDEVTYSMSENTVFVKPEAVEHYKTPDEFTTDVSSSSVYYERESYKFTPIVKLSDNIIVPDEDDKWTEISVSVNDVSYSKDASYKWGSNLDIFTECKDGYEVVDFTYGNEVLEDLKHFVMPYEDCEVIINIKEVTEADDILNTPVISENIVADVPVQEAQEEPLTEITDALVDEGLLEEPLLDNLSELEDVSPELASFEPVKSTELAKAEKTEDYYLTEKKSTYEMTMVVGQKTDLIPADVWDTADAKIARVSNGKISGKTIGETKVMRYGSFPTEFNVTVVDPKTLPKKSNGSVSGNKVIVGKGKSIQVFAKDKWVSSDKKIVTVTNAGKVTAKKAGEVTVTATGTRNREYKIKVLSPAILIKNKKITVSVGSITDLSNRLVDSDLPITYSVANPQIAYVDAYDNLIALKAGSTKLNVIINEKNYTFSVSVVNNNISGGLVNATEIFLLPKKTFSLSVKFAKGEKKKNVDYSMTGTNVTQTTKGKTVTYSDGIISVTNKGKIRAIADGVSYVNVAIQNGNSYKVKVTVEGDKVLNLPTEIKLNINEQYYIDTSSVCSQHVVWKSNKTSVATVDPYGVITGRKAGSAKVYTTVSGKKYQIPVIVTNTGSKKNDLSKIIIQQTIIKKADATNPKIVRRIFADGTYETVELYNITYHLQGGRADNPSDYSVTDTFTLNNPVKNGYIFTGWTGSNGNTPQQIVTISNEKGHKEYIANYKEEIYHSVTFNSNGGSDVTPKRILDGDVVTKPDDPSKDKYVFMYWALNGYRYDFSRPVKSDLTLDAVWEPDINFVYHTVSFDSAGGSNVASQSIQHNKKAAWPPNPKKDGYVFSKWTLSGNDYDFESPVVSDIELKAEYIEITPSIETCMITYDSNGGSNVDSESVLKGTSAHKPVDPEREGYTFVKWTFNDRDYDFSNPVNEDIELKALWNIIPTGIKYTVHFDTLGGSDVSDVQVDAGTLLERPDDPVKAECGFVEWNKDDEYYDFTEPVNEDLTLKAKWFSNPRYIALDTDKDNINDIIIPVDESGHILRKDIYNSDGILINEVEFVINGVTYKFNVSDPMPEAVINHPEVKASCVEPDIRETYVYVDTDNDGEWDVRIPVDQKGNVIGNFPVNKNDEAVTKIVYIDETTGNPVTVDLVNEVVPKSLINNRKAVVGGEGNEEQVSIKLNTDSTTTIDTISVNAYTKVGDLPKPDNSQIDPNYEFDAWYDVPIGQSGNRYGVNDVIGGVSNITFYAHYKPKTYTLTFIPGNGDANVTKTYTYLESIGDKYSLNTLGRLGYAYQGWFMGDTLVNSGYVPNAVDAEVVCKWKANTHTLSFDFNGGTGTPASKTVSFDSAYGTLPEPNKEGYTFMGYIDASENPVDENTILTVDSNVTIKATWKADTHTLRYMRDADTVYNQAAKVVTYDDVIGELYVPPIVTGKTFKEWNTSIDGTGTKVKAEDINKFTENIDIYAIYEPNTYTVTFDSNGGSDVPSMTRKFEEVLGELPVPVKPGWSLRAWKDGQSNVLSTNTMPARDLNLKADWEVGRYDVTVSANGGHFSNNTVSYVKEQIQHGAKYGAFLVPDREGYDFIGYKDVDGNDVDENSIMNFIEDTIIFAQWTPTQYDVNYDLAGGSMSGQKTTYDIESDEFILPTPTRSGYEFVGWTGSNGTTPQITVKVERGSIEDKSYTANWSPVDYTITYDLAGGEISGEKTTYNIESDDFTLKVPTRSGYEFVGWTGSNGTAPQITVKVERGSIENKNYTANWNAIDYSITYDLDGGSISDNLVSYNIETDTFTLPVPTKKGYDFVGWSGTDLTGDDNMDVTVNKGNINDRSYTAHWSATVYSITYDYAEGSPAENAEYPATYTIENSITIADPVRENYVFTGWSGTGLTGSDNKNLVISEGSIGNRSYVAHWVEAKFLVIYDANGGTVNPSSEEKYYNKPYGTLPTPTKVGYDFAGWVGPESEIVSVDDTMSYAHEITLTASWTAKTFTVSFNANGGSVETSSKTVTYDDTYGTLPTPTRNGYTFAGWFTDASDGTQKTATTTVSITDDEILYAHWTPISYTLTYDYNGGRAASGGKYPATYTIEDNLVAGVDITNPVRDGYEFAGWDVIDN